MDDKLLSYYNRELAYIRKAGAEFAEQHPKIAGRLRLDKDIVEDPHVSRLIESFAFLTSRIRRNIDDSFPELTEALMGLLYPDYHAPVPSCSVIQQRVIPQMAHTALVPAQTRMELGKGDTVCHFRTCFDNTVLPLTITDAAFTPIPVKAPALPFELSEGRLQSVMRVNVAPLKLNDLASIESDSLRFYIHGQPQLAFRLYEYLFHNLLGIAVARDPLATDAVFLSADALRPVGMADDEALIPFDGRTSRGHRLLSEFFIFPEKFLFAELQGLKSVWQQLPEGFQLYFYFADTDPELVQGIDGNTLIPGCTPIVNLFDEKTEPVRMAKIGDEFRLRIAPNYGQLADIHTVKRVNARPPHGERLAISPFYGSHKQRRQANESVQMFWSLRRENSYWHTGRPSRGTDSWLALVDDGFNPLEDRKEWVIEADVVATNRDLPGKLPFGPGEPRVAFYEGGSGLRQSCLLPPTPALQPRLQEATRWQLIHHISLQCFGERDGVEVLKEVLRLYDLQGTKSSGAIINGITGLSTETTTARIIQQGRAALCQGTRIVLEFDPLFDSSNSLYLFSALLSEFFAQLCAMNSFTQLVVKLQHKPQPYIEWPPRNGAQVLL
ncbi:type VI secretion system baseplate subunit TssF [Oceanobacter mangrovi]|uniref:type VI secretion system baseplate subunit TssF n=1 Tax=Oceanobacter mangrovi TaxID=2862510 RepID=UPI001C8DA70E|nr:type VI secretion system baseplate subunit TssF [Oceanobacter mangrovi]